MTGTLAKKATVHYRKYALALLLFGWPVPLCFICPPDLQVALGGLCFVNGFAVSVWARLR